MNSKGKVLVIFLVITAILLVSLTAVSIFFYQKETERRKLTEVTLEEHQSEKVKIEENLAEVKKQNFLLLEKNKEADDRINDLSDELELEKGLREEMKLETVLIEEELEKLKEEKEAYANIIEEIEGLQQKLTKDLSMSEQKIKELEAQLKAEVKRSQKLGELYKQQEEKVVQLELLNVEQQQIIKEQKVQASIIREPQVQEEKVIDTLEIEQAINEAPGNVIPQEVELEAIVINPETIVESLSSNRAALFESASDGRVLIIDVEMEFVIVNLGTKNGIKKNNILSVYRGENYVGDIKITRLQPEMSAADLIAPLTIRSIRKNDQVKIK